MESCPLLRSGSSEEESVNASDRKIRGEVISRMLSIHKHVKKEFGISIPKKNDVLA